MVESIEEISLRHDVTVMTVAHAGDGNVHPTFVFDRRADGSVPDAVWTAADEVFRRALELVAPLQVSTASGC